MLNLLFDTSTRLHIVRDYPGEGMIVEGLLQPTCFFSSSEVREHWLNLLGSYSPVSKESQVQNMSLLVAKSLDPALKLVAISRAG